MRLQSFLTLFTRATTGTPARGGNGEEERKVEKSWQGPGVGRKGGGGRLDKKEWGGEGETGLPILSPPPHPTPCPASRLPLPGLGQWGGNWEGQLRGEDGEGGDVRVAKGRGRRRGKRRRHFTDGYDLMSSAIGLSCKQIVCLGRQRLWCSPLATSTCNAWVE